MYRVSISICGVVQGVGFRYTTHRLAQGLPVSGYVKNLPSGEVELLAQGEPEIVNELQERIAEKAITLGVPVPPEKISVTREGSETTAALSYSQPVAFVPGYYYPVPLSFSVEAFSLQTTPIAPRLVETNRITASSESATTTEPLWAWAKELACSGVMFRSLRSTSCISVAEGSRMTTITALPSAQL